MLPVLAKALFSAAFREYEKYYSSESPGSSFQFHSLSKKNSKDYDINIVIGRSKRVAVTAGVLTRTRCLSIMTITSCGVAQDMWNIQRVFRIVQMGCDVRRMYRLKRSYAWRT